MNLLRMMEAFPQCKEFIFSSSAAVYGEQDNCTEEFNCLPISPYGESKLCVDMLLRSAARARPDWKVISLRYFNPAGNHHAGILGDNPIGNTPANLFSIIQEVIIGKRSQVVVFGKDYNTPDGTGVRDFVHVVDLGTNHMIKQRDICRLCSICNRCSTIMKFSTSDREVGSACWKLLNNSENFCSMMSVIVLGRGGREI